VGLVAGSPNPTAISLQIEVSSGEFGILEQMERVYHQWQLLPYEIHVEHEIWIYNFPNMLEIA
jgi:hypothetical protein